MPSSPSTSNHEPLVCRCCLSPVHTFVQPDMKGYEAHTYAHCVNRDCKLYYATRELRDWLTMDLRQWEATQHPNWRPPVFVASPDFLPEELSNHH